MDKIEKWINKIHCGNAITLLKQLPDNSIDMCCSSPPYYGLRSYNSEPQIWDGNNNCEHIFNEQINISTRHKKGETNPGKEAWYKEKDGSNQCAGIFCEKCHTWKGELGQEPTPELFISHLTQIFTECKRILKPTGSLWINIGDSFMGSNQGYGASKSSNTGFSKAPIEVEYYAASNGKVPQSKKHPTIRRKSLCMIPERLAINLIEAGFILRNKIIWHKENCVPSSVTDRFTCSYEYLYFFTKNPNYFFEQQFEPIKQSSINRASRGIKKNKSTDGQYAGLDQDNISNLYSKIMNGEIIGRNQRDLWTINNHPNPEAHFATFCEELITIPIKSTVPEFICKKCGFIRKIIYDVKGISTTDKNKEFGLSDKQKEFGDKYTRQNMNRAGSHIWDKTYKKTGYTHCNCYDDPEKGDYEKGIVLDPFSGTNTTGLVARKLNRNFISIELNPSYIKIANKRMAQELGMFIKN